MTLDTSDRPHEPFDFEPDEAFARQLDDEDRLTAFRSRFRIPERPAGGPVLYFTGNSLGLRPAGAAEAVQDELDRWARLGVDAHFDGDAPWFSYHELVRDPLARLVGAQPDEVVAMNSLTVNLHLMMVTFYRPSPSRSKILIEDCAFPSDNYAVRTQLRHHGRDVADALIVARSSRGHTTMTTEEMEQLLKRHGHEIAVVLLGGVNYYTGQVFDMRRITACAQEQGCIVGLDLAHAVGNVPLRLHDWNVDFAVWCSYKYLNAGPGAVAGCFVHGRHAQRTDLPRFGGWWGNDPDRRFLMHLESEFEPRPTADGWQLSNPPILALAPLRVSLQMFEEAGMTALRAKSRRLTAYLHSWIDHVAEDRIEVLTPCGADERGCVAPVPLYNSFADVWSFGQALQAWSR
ncbi:MAG: kynureninase [Planctomycetota bacterium]|jgi:kynureninase